MMDPLIGTILAIFLIGIYFVFTFENPHGRPGASKESSDRDKVSAPLKKNGTEKTKSSSDDADEKKKRIELGEKFDLDKRQKISVALDKHKIAIITNFAGSLRLDEYGKVVTDARPAEFSRFLEIAGFKAKDRYTDRQGKIRNKSASYTRTPANYTKFTDKNYYDPKKLTLDIENSFFKEIVKLVDNYTNQGGHEAALQNPPSDGLEFEYWVANRLTSYGWNAKVTSGSGDQGVDIIATIGETSVGIQCKRFSKPVGNKAVQEVSAGKQHYKLQCAAVISTAGFTKSAKDLASSTGVILLSEQQIPMLRGLVEEC